IKKEFKEFGRNMQIVSKGLPEADNKNKALAAIGKILDELSNYTGGLTPSHGDNGGLVGNIPVIVGGKDIEARPVQARRANDPYVRAHPDEFISITEFPSYSDIPEARRTALSGMVVSKPSLKYTLENATSQVTVNGILNSIPEAILNGMEQTNANVITVLYNPSHGIIGDLLESFVDVSTPFHTGVAKQTGKSASHIKNINERKGINTNFAPHSQGNGILASGIRYVGKGAFATKAKADGADRHKKTSVTVTSYGSPVNWKKMKKTVEGAGMTFSGSYVNAKDMVGITVGGNAPGKNQTSNLMDRVKAVKDTPKLFHNVTSPHHYKCMANCGNDASQQPSAQEASNGSNK
ncbi:hypothetical protein D6779_06305, partial [Candidatus Parcubacteria bacterium]